MTRVCRPGETKTVAARPYGKPGSGPRLRLYIIVFEADTRAGRAFDVALIAAILVSLAVVVMDSVESISRRYGDVLRVLEWGSTLLFTIEYLARLWCVRHPLRCARSFFGIVDLLAFLPRLTSFQVALRPTCHSDSRVYRS